MMCTGNICRSPMAAALLQRDLDKRGIDAHVTSAGLLAADQPAADEVIELMNEQGLDVRGHASRTITAELLAGADLVIGMGREHVREAAVLQPRRFRRTFTLKELVRRGREQGPRLADESIDEWLDKLSVDRLPTDCLGASEIDDIEDPIGRRLPVFRRTATEIEELTGELLDLLWPATSAFGAANADRLDTSESSFELDLSWTNESDESNESS